MAVRRTKKSTSKKNTTISKIPYEYKQGIIAILFIIIAVLVVISDTKTIFGNFLYAHLNSGF